MYPIEKQMYPTISKLERWQWKAALWSHPKEKPRPHCSIGTENRHGVDAYMVRQWDRVQNLQDWKRPLKVFMCSLWRFLLSPPTGTFTHTITNNMPVTSTYSPDTLLQSMLFNYSFYAAKVGISMPIHWSYCLLPFGPTGWINNFSVTISSRPHILYVV